MSTLNLDQKLELTEMLAEAFSYQVDSEQFPDDIALEVIDSWLPVYYHDINEQWHNAGSCEIEDVGLIADEERGNIYRLMVTALWEQGNAWMWKLWTNYSEEPYIVTVEQALTACNTYLMARGVQPYTRNGLRAGLVSA